MEEVFTKLDVGLSPPKYSKYFGSRCGPGSDVPRAGPRSRTPRYRQVGALSLRN
jgi:hypothetical protein